MASRTNVRFMVYVCQCEIDEIRKQFQQRRKKESDGDLFGLWTNSGHAVVHLVSGITETSPNSRINDLKVLLEEKYMLCHIGKWRFNPSVTSSEPSASDKTLAERFYARSDGQKACILLKFNEGESDIQIYLFVQGTNQQVSAELSILPGSPSSDEATTENPLRNVSAIREKLQIGGTPLSTSQRRGSNDGSSSWETFGNENGGNAKNSSALTPTLFSLSQTITVSSSHTNQTSSVSLTNQRSAPLQGIGQHGNSSSIPPSSPAVLKPAPKLNDAGENMLKQVREKVTSIKDLKTDVLHREPSTGNVELKLEVNQINCTVRFPVTFPEEPAKIFCRLPKQLYIFEVKHPNAKFDSVDSILSVVKFWFDSHIGVSSLSSANAITTPQVNGDSPCSEAPPDNIDLVEDEVCKFAEEVREKIKKTFKIVGDVDSETKTETSGKKVELTFQHYNKEWLIVLPGKFREQSTQVYHVILGRKRMLVQEVCELSDQIVSVIRNRCDCGSCFGSR